MTQTAISDSKNSIFSKLAAEPLAQQALNMIRRAIINGDLKPNQPIREAEIASQLGISRAPVREALLVLEEEGFVERVPYKGTFVTPFSRRDVEELYSLRAVLESFSIELLVQCVSDEDIQELRAIVGKMQAAAEANDADTLNDYDLEFHERMMTMAGHKRLLTAWQGLKFPIRRVVAAGNFSNEDLDQIVRNHLPILEALEARDAAEASRLIKLHIADSGRRTIARWEGTQDHDG